MSDDFTPNDDVQATGPIPMVNVPDLVLTAPLEPDPEVPLVAPVAPVVDVPAPGAPELEQDQPAPALATRAALVSDAKTRSWRTLLQGLVVAVLGSVGFVVATYLKNGDATSVDWQALGMTVLMAGGTSVASYLHKMLGTSE